MKLKNVRTATLRKYIHDGTIKLSKNDREFLRDLARVKIIDAKDASEVHYSHLKDGAERRLERLKEAGVLERVDVHQPGRGKFKSYVFRTDAIARLFGGKRPVLGAKRNALHEVITSKLFFAEGRPESFIVESDFSSKQKELFKQHAPTLANRHSAIPDAMYLDDSGEMVLVEADSGQYSKRQIISKQKAWSGFKQVWGQPSKAMAKVDDAVVHRF